MAINEARVCLIIEEEIKKMINEGIMDFSKNLGRKTKMAAAGMAMMAAPMPSSAQPSHDASVSPAAASTVVRKDSKTVEDKIFALIRSKLMEPAVMTVLKYRGLKPSDVAAKLAVQIYNNIRTRFPSSESIQKAADTVFSSSRAIAPLTQMDITKGASK